MGQKDALSREMINHNIEAFYALLRGGLWEGADVNLDLNLNDNIDWEEVYQVAEEQSVIGVVLAGMEHSVVKPPQEVLLQWIGEVQMVEQTNKEMNKFIEKLVEEMREADIYTLLVKGQGIAQCYERPLWRSSGDIDFYLSDVNFKKAKEFFRHLVESFDPDTENAQHINMHYGEWVVEIHANQHCSISVRVNRVMDEIHRDLFYGGSVRSWKNGNTQVFLPSLNNDVLIVFTHFLNHFFRGGVGVRQICDWCRLLWTYKDTIKTDKLKSYVKRSGLVSEWEAFGAYVVEYLGMPIEAVPLLNESANVNRGLKRKAERIKDFILMSGNFGHNRDMSYYDKYPYPVRKFYSMKMRVGDLISHARIFPLDSIRFSFWIIWNGLRSAVRGE